jgi:hypothetical protein
MQNDMQDKIIEATIKLQEAAYRAGFAACKAVALECASDMPEVLRIAALSPDEDELARLLRRMREMSR